MKFRTAKQALEDSQKKQVDLDAACLLLAHNAIDQAVALGKTEVKINRVRRSTIATLKDLGYSVSGQGLGECLDEVTVRWGHAS